jgi:hypothetical protein
MPVVFLDEKHGLARGENIVLRTEDIVTAYSVDRNTGRRYGRIVFRNNHEINFELSNEGEFVRTMMSVLP